MGRPGLESALLDRSLLCPPYPWFSLKGYPFAHVGVQVRLPSGCCLIAPVFAFCHSVGEAGDGELRRSVMLQMCQFGLLPLGM